jgi:iron(III) transport system substrate-binding protein
MKRMNAFAVAIAVTAASAVQAQELTPALKELVAAASKEGTLTLSWSPSTFAGAPGAARAQAAMNRMFGTNVHINFVPGPDMARIGNQLATEFSAGQKAHVDIMLGAAPQMAPLMKLNFFEPVDWKHYLPARIDASMSELDGKLIRVVTGLSGATYNSRLAPMKPTALEDFLRPEWKGKIASTPYAAGFDVLLAEDVWGKDKTFAYVRKLTTQITGLIRCGQDALQWQEKGAPLAQMMPLDAAQQRYYYFAVPKNAQHPNAAKLYTLFMLSEEGQKISYETWKTDLHTFAGSRMGKMVEDFKKLNVKFKEVTTEWYLRHPEIDASKSELIKIITTKS